MKGIDEAIARLEAAEGEGRFMASPLIQHANRGDREWYASIARKCRRTINRLRDK